MAADDDCMRPMVMDRLRVSACGPGRGELFRNRPCRKLSSAPPTAQKGSLPAAPKGYLCYRAAGPIQVDGRLDEAAWQTAPWTDPFVDIEGDVKPKPRFQTRVKMLWDDQFFYVGALLEEPHVWATLTKHDSVIFQDNDFEIFIDPDGDNHEYYEIEINALNTEWDLFLRKPYRDGGPAINEWEIPGLKTAVHVDGTLNNASDADTSWSVEFAIPWKVLGEFAHRPAPPRDGDQWRVNFSRVEWQHQIVDGQDRKVPNTTEDNWVWSPQGAIDMHRPERWGYVQFSTASPGQASYRPDPAGPIRDRLMQIYQAQTLSTKKTTAGPQKSRTSYSPTQPDCPSIRRASGRRPTATRRPSPSRRAAERRRPGRSARIRGSATERLGQPAIASGKIQEWLATLILARNELADEDIVIAARQNVVNPAVEECEAIGQDRRAGRRRRDVEVGEILGSRGGKSPRDVLLLEAEDVYREAAVLLQVVERRGAFIDGDQDERRVERERGDGVGREAVAARLAIGRHHGDTRGEVAHDLPLHLRVERHGGSRFLALAIGGDCHRGSSPVADRSLYAIAPAGKTREAPRPLW